MFCSFLLSLGTWVIGSTMLAFVAYSGQGTAIEFVEEFYHHVFALFKPPHAFEIPFFDIDLAIVITLRPYEGKGGAQSAGGSLVGLGLQVHLHVRVWRTLPPLVAVMGELSRGGNKREHGREV